MVCWCFGFVGASNERRKDGVSSCDLMCGQVERLWKDGKGVR